MLERGAFDVARQNRGRAGNGNGQTTSDGTAETRRRLRGRGAFAPGGGKAFQGLDQVRERHGQAEREAGTLEAGPQGRRGHGRLAGARERVRERMAGKPDTTLDGLTVALREECSIEAHRSPVVRLLRRLRLSHRKRSRGR